MQSEFLSRIVHNFKKVKSQVFEVILSYKNRCNLLIIMGFCNLYIVHFLLEILFLSKVDGKIFG